MDKSQKVSVFSTSSFAQQGTVLEGWQPPGVRVGSPRGAQGGAGRLVNGPRNSSLLAVSNLGVSGAPFKGLVRYYKVL